jgi:uncharacterized protein YjiS (DUF1127 family)
MRPRHHIVRHSTLSLLEAMRALSAVVAGRLAHAAKIVRHRRDLEFLARLDDRMLRDIGLTRSDLRYALTEPFWRDPGAALISRVGQRGIGKVRPTSVPSILPAPSGWAARKSPGRVPRRAA